MLMMMRRRKVQTMNGVFDVLVVFLMCLSFWAYSILVRGSAKEKEQMMRERTAGCEV
jgi:hypothetical protein